MGQGFACCQQAELGRGQDPLHEGYDYEIPGRRWDAAPPSESGWTPPHSAAAGPNGGGPAPEPGRPHNEAAASPPDGPLEGATGEEAAAARPRRAPGGGAEDGGDAAPRKPLDEALLKAEELMKDYDVLEAEAVLASALAQLEGQGQAKAADELLTSSVFEEVVDRVGQYDAACDMLTDGHLEVLYESADGKFELHQPKGVGTWFEYRMTVNIEAPLSECISTGHELDFVQKAQPLVAGVPQNLSPPHNFLMTTLSKMSVLFFRVELLFEILRVRDRRHGVLTEVIRSAFPPKGRAIPEKGWRTIRPWIYTANLWMPRGGGQAGTVLVQVTRVDCTVNVPQFVLNLIFRQMSRAFMADLRKTALRALQPGSPWAERIAEDRSGLYRDLRELECSAQGRQHITAQTMPGKEELFQRPWRLRPPPPDTRPPSSR